VSDLNGAASNLGLCATGARALFIAGFTKASSAPCQAMEDSLWASYPSATSLRVFAVMELQGVPAFLIPLIRHSVRSKTPPARWTRVFLERRGRAALESYFEYTDADPNDAYVALLDAHGRLLWSGHGHGKSGFLERVRKAVEERESPKMP
ncbi:MAG: hypothetical protein ACREKE_01370, partial [bacterium]